MIAIWNVERARDTAWTNAEALWALHDTRRSRPRSSPLSIAWSASPGAACFFQTESRCRSMARRLHHLIKEVGVWLDCPASHAIVWISDRAAAQGWGFMLRRKGESMGPLCRRRSLRRFLWRFHLGSWSSCAADDVGTATTVLRGSARVIKRTGGHGQCLAAGPTKNTPCIRRSSLELAKHLGSSHEVDQAPIDGTEQACVLTVARQEIAYLRIWRDGARALNRTTKKATAPVSLVAEDRRRTGRDAAASSPQSSPEAAELAKPHDSPCSSQFGERLRVTTLGV